MELITYRIKPYCLYGSPFREMLKPGGVWLHDVINLIMNRHKGLLRSKNLRTDVFHNHNENDPSKTNSDYPLVIYHHIKDSFFVTGINDGKLSLVELMDQYDKPINIPKELFLIHQTWGKPLQTHLELIPEMTTYTLTDWLALNPDNHRKYLAISNIREKITYLEDLLKAHIYYNFLEHIQPGFNYEGLKVKIINITDFQHSRVHVPRNKINYDYQPFSVLFETNVNLPDMIAIGICQALGFGLVKKTDD